MACFLPLRPSCFLGRRVCRLSKAPLPYKCERPSSLALQRHLGVLSSRSPSSYSRSTSTVNPFRKTPRSGLLCLLAFEERATLQSSTDPFRSASRGFCPPHENSHPRVWLPSRRDCPLVPWKPLSAPNALRLRLPELSSSPVIVEEFPLPSPLPRFPSKPFQACYRRLSGLIPPDQPFPFLLPECLVQVGDSWLS